MSKPLSRPDFAEYSLLWTDVQFITAKVG